MNEGIWINVFMVFCGLWMALIFVFIGVVIERARVDYRSYKSVLRGNTGADVCVHDGIRDRADVQHSPARDSRQHRCDKKYNPNKEEMRTVLEYFRIGATSYEKRVLDAVLERVCDE